MGVIAGSDIFKLKIIIDRKQRFGLVLCFEIGSVRQCIYEAVSVRGLFTDQRSCC